MVRVRSMVSRSADGAVGDVVDDQRTGGFVDEAGITAAGQAGQGGGQPLTGLLQGLVLGGDGCGLGDEDCCGVPLGQLRGHHKLPCCLMGGQSAPDTRRDVARRRWKLGSTDRCRLGVPCGVGRPDRCGSRESSAGDSLKGSGVVPLCAPTGVAITARRSRLDSGRCVQVCGWHPGLRAAGDDRLMVRGTTVATRTGRGDPFEGQS